MEAVSKRTDLCRRLGTARRHPAVRPFRLVRGDIVLVEKGEHMATDVRCSSRSR